MRRPLRSARAPLFLPRPEYRRRRLVDAARMLPVFGGFLMLLPILWTPADMQGRNTAQDGMYLFFIWAVLVGFAAWLAPSLADAADDGADAEGDADGGADRGADGGANGDALAVNLKDDA